jgi:hypothetical protein
VQFRESKLSQREFAATWRMPASNLSRWIREEEGQAAKVDNAESGSFLEVSASVLSVPETPPLVIHWPGGATLEVVAGTDPAWLGRLLGSLQPCSA